MPAAHDVPSTGCTIEERPAVAAMAGRGVVSPEHWGQCHDHRLEGSTMKYTKTIAFGTVIAWATAASGAVMAREAPTLTIAVIDFTNNSDSASWWHGGVGSQLADVLSNELSSTGDFKVIERQKINSVLAEQDLASSYRMRPGSSPHTGNITGAQYLVTGSVASYTEDAAKTGGGLNFAGFHVGGGQAKAYVAIDLRVIDAETSEVVFSRT